MNTRGDVFHHWFVHLFAHLFFFRAFIPTEILYKSWALFWCTKTRSTVCSMFAVRSSFNLFVPIFVVVVVMCALYPSSVFFCTGILCWRSKHTNQWHYVFENIHAKRCKSEMFRKKITTEIKLRIEIVFKTNDVF